MRPHIDLSDEDYERAEEYANNHGLRMPRALGDLVRAGLEAETDGEEGE